ncbi:MAG: polysaccharide lyase beta-sandwich domain-containing protein [Cyclobacteriaceae bacterium]
MVFGKYPDAGAKNRSIARQGTLKAMGTSTPKQLLKTSDYRADELKEIIRVREGGLENVSRLQAVYHKKLGLTQAVFYQAGNLELGNGLQLSMDGPGQIMLQYEGNVVNKITVADPSRKMGKMHLRINDPISIDLPQGINAGKSVS